MKSILLSICLAVIVIGCQTKEAEMTFEQRQEIAIAVEKTFNDHVALFRDLTVENYDKSMSYWVESDDPAWMNNPAIAQNMLYTSPTKEAIDKAWRPKPEGNIKGNDHQLDKGYVAVISKECAVYVFTGKWEESYKDGTPSVSYPLSGSYVYVLRDGQWKMLHMHQSWKE